jgi:hypothetical protein
MCQDVEFGIEHLERDTSREMIERIHSNQPFHDMAQVTDFKNNFEIVMSVKIVHFTKLSCTKNWAFGKCILGVTMISFPGLSVFNIELCAIHSHPQLQHDRGRASLGIGLSLKSMARPRHLLDYGQYPDELIPRN